MKRWQIESDSSTVLGTAVKSAERRLFYDDDCDSAEMEARLLFSQFVIRCRTLHGQCGAARLEIRYCAGELVCSKWGTYINQWVNKMIN